MQHFNAYNEALQEKISLIAAGKRVNESMSEQSWLHAAFRSIPLMSFTVFSKVLNKS